MYICIYNINFYLSIGLNRYLQIWEGGRDDDEG